MALRGEALQVWSQELQQPRVQLLGLVKDEQALLAALPRPLDLAC